MPMETTVACYDANPNEPVERPEEMNVTAACERGLGESVSFGRFSLDTFSWMRRSSFNQNQYQEELENFSLPGSVREKKAYFEAYYKALAKKKALERSLAEGSCVTEEQTIENMGYATVVEQCNELEQALELSMFVPSIVERKPEKVVAEASNNSLMVNSKGEAEDGQMVLPSQYYADVQDSRDAVPLHTEQERKKILPLLSSGEFEGHNFALHMGVIQEIGEGKCDDTVEEIAHEQKCMEVLDKVEVNEHLNHNGNQMPGLNELPAQKKSRSRHKMGNVVRGRPSQSVSQESKDWLSAPSSVAVKISPRTATKYVTERTNRKQTGIQGTNGVKGSTHQGLLNSGNSQSNFTVPQPFALETDKRASLVLQLPEHNAIARTLQNGSVQASSTSKNTKVVRKLGQKLAAAKLSQDRLKPLDELTKAKRPELEAKQHTDGVTSATPLVRQTGSRENRKVNYSKASSNNFNFKSDERAERRKEFNSKLEERIRAKKAEENQAEAKTQEQVEAQISQLRKSLAFKATPMPNFYKDSSPPKMKIKKIPPTRAISPKLGRKQNGVGANPNPNAQLLSQFIDSDQDQKVSCLSHKSSDLTEKVNSRLQSKPQSKNSLCFSKQNVNKVSISRSVNEKLPSMILSSATVGENHDELTGSRIKSDHSYIFESKEDTLLQESSYDDVCNVDNDTIIRNYSVEVARVFHSDNWSPDKFVSDIEKAKADKHSEIPEEKTVNKSQAAINSIFSRREEITIASVISPSMGNAMKEKASRLAECDSEGEGI